MAWYHIRANKLTHCGLVTLYGDMELGQHWLRKWLVAWRHQAITWTNVDLSLVRSINIHLRAISPEIPQLSITRITLKTTYPKFYSNSPGANELSTYLEMCFPQFVVNSWFQTNLEWILRVLGEWSYDDWWSGVPPRGPLGLLYTKFWNIKNIMIA